MLQWCIKHIRQICYWKTSNQSKKVPITLKEFHQAAWTLSFEVFSVGLAILDSLPVDLVKFGMYLQHRLWTPLIFLGASAAAKPACISDSLTIKRGWGEWLNNENLIRQLVLSIVVPVIVLAEISGGDHLLIAWWCFYCIRTFLVFHNFPSLLNLVTNLKFKNSHQCFSHNLGHYFCFIFGTSTVVHTKIINFSTYCLWFVCILHTLKLKHTICMSHLANFLPGFKDHNTIQYYIE